MDGCASGRADLRGGGCSLTTLEPDLKSGLVLACTAEFAVVLSSNGKRWGQLRGFLLEVNLAGRLAAVRNQYLGASVARGRPKLTKFGQSSADSRPYVVEFGQT